MPNQRVIDQRITQKLEQRAHSGNLRHLSHIDGIDFCSNDYLSLARVGFEQSSLLKLMGATGSRLISGDNHATQDFEKQVAQHHGFETTLLFPSGYSANLGLLSCLGQRGDIYLMDELIHASLIDGARLSFAKRHRFAHNNLSDLRTKLEQLHSKLKKDAQIFVVIESIYSMDGDHAPLQKISELCEKYNVALIVDEAHSIGILGKQGEGLVASLNLHNKVLATILTFGKAVGCHGAVIAGSNQLRNFLINYCRPFIYSTASSPHTIELLSYAHNKMIHATDARKKLTQIQLYFKQKLDEISLEKSEWIDSNSPIQVLKVSDTFQAKSLESNLKIKGFAVKAILSPTVAKGSERIRICLHSHNTTDEIDGLADAITNAAGMTL